MNYISNAMLFLVEINIIYVFLYILNLSRNQLQKSCWNELSIRPNFYFFMLFFSYNLYPWRSANILQLWHNKNLKHRQYLSTQ